VAVSVVAVARVVIAMKEEESVVSDQTVADHAEENVEVWTEKEKILTEHVTA